jgi:hypothetical protein
MVDVCDDCGLPLAPDRKTRNQRVGYMYCGARFSPHYEIQCKRIAVVRLRTELADWQLIKDDPVVAGRLITVKLAAERRSGLAIPPPIPPADEAFAALDEHLLRYPTRKAEAAVRLLRTELASARAQAALTEAERWVLDAVVLWRQGECGNVMLEKYVDTLLALRAKEKAR